MASESLPNRPAAPAPASSPTDPWLTVSGWIWMAYLAGTALSLVWWFW